MKVAFSTKKHFEAVVCDESVAPPFLSYGSTVCSRKSRNNVRKGMDTVNVQFIIPNR